MPNIYDVAKRARVSVATVSAVLNDSAFVSAGLKSRVQSAVDALGYQPNLLARSMAKQRTQAALKDWKIRAGLDLLKERPDAVYPWMDSFSPRLTTIDLPKRELGAAAAQLLVERIARKSGRPRTIKLKNAMRVRESCGCGLRGSAALAR
jgi:DNA-binding LacI/PurR family transcriptional regulator